MNRIGYDKFGQRTYMKYCNGAETFYTYDPHRRRLQNLKVNAGGNTIMDNAYTYDAVSKVLSVANGAALPENREFTITSHYKFDTSIAQRTQDVGDGIALIGYGFTLSIVGAEIRIPLAKIGNAVSTAGSAFGGYFGFIKQ